MRSKGHRTNGLLLACWSVLPVSSCSLDNFRHRIQAQADLAFDTMWVPNELKNRGWVD